MVNYLKRLYYKIRPKKDSSRNIGDYEVKSLNKSLNTLNELVDELEGSVENLEKSAKILKKAGENLIIYNLDNQTQKKTSWN